MPVLSGEQDASRARYRFITESDGTVGLKARLLQLPVPDIWTAFKKIGQPQAVYEEAVLRSLASERNMQVSQNGHVYPDYGGNVDGTIANAATRLASSTGNILGSIAAFTKHYRWCRRYCKRRW